jgi:hypothetical protein
LIDDAHWLDDSKVHTHTLDVLPGTGYPCPALTGLGSRVVGKRGTGASRRAATPLIDETHRR